MTGIILFDLVHLIIIQFNYNSPLLPVLAAVICLRFLMVSDLTTYTLYHLMIKFMFLKEFIMSQSIISIVSLLNFPTAYHLFMLFIAYIYLICDYLVVFYTHQLLPVAKYLPTS